MNTSKGNSVSNDMRIKGLMAKNRVMNAFLSACEIDSIDPIDAFNFIGTSLGLNNIGEPVVQAKKEPSKQDIERSVKTALVDARKEKAKRLNLSLDEINLSKDEKDTITNNVRLSLGLTTSEKKNQNNKKQQAHKVEQQKKVQQSVVVQAEKAEDKNKQQPVKVEVKIAPNNNNEDKTVNGIPANLNGGGSYRTHKDSLSDAIRACRRKATSFMEGLDLAIHWIAYRNAYIVLEDRYKVFGEKYPSSLSTIKDPFAGLANVHTEIRENYTAEIVAAANLVIQSELYPGVTFKLQNLDGQSFWNGSGPGEQAPEPLKRKIPIEIQEDSWFNLEAFKLEF